MLPFFTLQTIQLETGDLAQKGPEPLPAGAVRPAALFAEVLRANVDEVDAALPSDGTPLPVGGNPLPAPAVAAAIDAEGPPARTPVPAASSSVAFAIRSELPQPGPSPNGMPAVAGPPQPSPDARTTPLANPRIGQLPGPAPGAEPGDSVQLPDAPRTTPRPIDSGHIGHLRGTAADSAVPDVLRNGPAGNPDAARLAAAVAVPLAEPRNDTRAPREPAPLWLAPRDVRVRGRAELAPAKSLPAAAGESRPATPALPPAAPPAAAIAAADAVPAPQGMPQAPVAPSFAPSAAPAAPEPNLPPPQLHSSINVAVQEPQWGEQLGERVQLMANSRLQSAEIRLTPAELGPVRVQVAVDDGNATVTFHAQHALTRDAIEQAMPRLRELLSESGLTLQQASVAGDDARQGSREAGSGERDAPADTRTSRDEGGADDGVPGADERLERARRRDGLVDTFA